MMPLWTLAQTAGHAEDFKNNADYIWGQGYGATVKDADQEALANLMSKISVSVSSDFMIDEREVNTAAGNDAQSTVQNVVRTYSQGTLKNTRSVIVTEGPPEAAVIRYIKRSDLEKIFKEREENVLSYVYSARNAEKAGRIDAALRYYYWASCLLKSLQNPSQVKFSEDGVKFPMTMWIPEQINLLLSNNIDPFDKLSILADAIMLQLLRVMYASASMSYSLSGGGKAKGNQGKRTLGFYRLPYRSPTGKPAESIRQCN